jgi:hypothetical protein
MYPCRNYLLFVVTCLILITYVISEYIETSSFKIVLWEKLNLNHTSLLRELKESNPDYFNKLTDVHIAKRFRSICSSYCLYILKSWILTFDALSLIV